MTCAMRGPCKEIPFFRRYAIFNAMRLPPFLCFLDQIVYLEEVKSHVQIYRHVDCSDNSSSYFLWSSRTIATNLCFFCLCHSDPLVSLLYVFWVLLALLDASFHHVIELLTPGYQWLIMP